MAEVSETKLVREILATMGAVTSTRTTRATSIANKSSANLEEMRKALWKHSRKLKFSATVADKYDRCVALYEFLPLKFSDISQRVFSVEAEVKNLEASGAFNADHFVRWFFHQTRVFGGPIDDPENESEVQTFMMQVAKEAVDFLFQHHPTWLSPENTKLFKKAKKWRGKVEFAVYTVPNSGAISPTVIPRRNTKKQWLFVVEAKKCRNPHLNPVDVAQTIAEMCAAEEVSFKPQAAVLWGALTNFCTTRLFRRDNVARDASRFSSSHVISVPAPPYLTQLPTTALLSSSPIVPTPSASSDMSLSQSMHGPSVTSSQDAMIREPASDTAVLSSSPIVPAPSASSDMSLSQSMHGPSVTASQDSMIREPASDTASDKFKAAMANTRRPALELLATFIVAIREAWTSYNRDEVISVASGVPEDADEAGSSGDQKESDTDTSSASSDDDMETDAGTEMITEHSDDDSQPKQQKRARHLDIPSHPQKRSKQNPTR